MEKVIFLDRDGVVNEMIYYPEHGILDSPFTAAQFRLLPGTAEAIKRFRGAGFKVIIVSNQPGIAKGNLSEATFEEIRTKMHAVLKREGAGLDGEFYCLHHPRAKLARLKVECDCRKPQPGLLHQAAEAMNIDLASSWMVGDGLTDIEAGKRAGCRTILIGKMKCELCHRMEETGARPDFVAVDLLEAARIVSAGDADRLSAGAGGQAHPGQ
jgi:D-glycero-D-manno-heptose 1,7-bisphosphate phosphatase